MKIQFTFYYNLYMDEKKNQGPPYFMRKIFILYPHTIIKGVYKEIIRNGYDAYIVEDHKIIFQFLKKYHHSILYINIDKFLTEEEWLSFTKKIIAHQDTKDTHIGIMTDARLKKKHLLHKYLLDVGITCGFISLTPNTKKILEVIIKILNANEAKGRRKFVRAQCIEGDSFNFIYNNNTHYGEIVDISLAGMCCILFDETLKLIPGMVIENMQLKLQGVISMVTGEVYGSREITEKKLLYVIVFNMDTIRPKGGENIINYICRRQEDFIKHDLDTYFETTTESKEEMGIKGDLRNKSNGLFIQEFNQELNVITDELEEIDDIINERKESI